MLGALPRAFRDGAKPWVLAEMAVRIDAMLADGHGPGAIVRAGEEIAAARPIGDRDHIDALRAVRAALRANGYDHQADDDTDRCTGCGARRTGTMPCLTCDPVEVIDVIEMCPACYEAPMTDDGLCANCLAKIDGVVQA